jgi:PIN domain nuclease of toxin-antitoxin system
MSDLAATDTHALVWYALDRPRKLGRAARRIFERTDRGQATIYVPVLVLVEIAEAARRGVVRFDDTFSRWVDRLLAPGRFLAAHLTLDIVLAAERFSAIPERGDRLIAATAAHLGCPLIAKDARLARIPGLRTIW